MARIKIIEFEEAEDRLLDIYSQIIIKRGKLAGVHKIQSLRPESIMKHMDLYMEIMYTKSELSRAEREMIAVIVSVANGCHYCQIHHADALNHFWKDNDKISKLLIDYQILELTDREKVLCSFAKNLTLNPAAFENPELIELLRKVGLNDPGILDTVLVVSYFNFVNRIVLSLDVELENESGGYKYKSV